MSTLRRPTHVYVMVGPTGLTKVGISYKPTRRRLQVQMARREAITLLWQSHRPNDARAIETEAHRRLAQHRVDGEKEWFAVTPQHAIEVLAEIIPPGIFVVPPKPPRPPQPKPPAGPSFSERLWVIHSEIAAYVEADPSRAGWEMGQMLVRLENRQ